MLGRVKEDQNRARVTATTNRKRERTFKKPKSRKPRSLSVLRNGLAGRLARGMLRVVFALAITGAVIFAGVGAYRHATTSKYFAFKTVSITGAKRLTQADILDVAGFTLGRNIFEIDISEARRLLLSHPWIVEAEVARKLPGSIHIDIAERRAEALINFDVLYLVDDSGKVFKRWVRGDPIPTPVITGIAREQFLENSTAVEDTIRDAIDLADRYRASGLDRLAPLAEVHSEPDGGFSLTVGDDPTYVRFGKGPYRNKLSRLSTLLSRLARDRAKPEVIYFDNEIRPDRITVKLKKGEETVSQSIPGAPDSESKKRVSKI
jgi:hypothetical protein